MPVVKELVQALVPLKRTAKEPYSIRAGGEGGVTRTGGVPKWKDKIHDQLES